MMHHLPETDTCHHQFWLIDFIADESGFFFLRCPARCFRLGVTDGDRLAFGRSQTLQTGFDLDPVAAFAVGVSPDFTLFRFFISSSHNFECKSEPKNKNTAQNNKRIRLMRTPDRTLVRALLPV